MDNSAKSGAPRSGASRREILRATPFAGLALLTPAAASTTAQAETPPTERTGRDPVYRQTELINRYYQRARF